jgi:hypothetical protein
MAREYFEKAKQKYDRNIQLQSALGECELALGYDPDFAEAQNLHGLILDALNRTQEAIAAYREAIRLDPNLQDARENLRDAEEEITSIQANSFSTVISEEKKGVTNVVLTVILSFVTLAILAGAGRFVLQVALPYLAPKTEIVFVPDVPDDVQVTQGDLELAARILTDRAGLLGYPQVAFEATPSGEITGKFPAIVGAREIIERVGSIGLLEFVDFGETSIMEGTIVRTDFENDYTAQIEGKTWHTVMTNNGISAADVFEGSMQGANINYQINLTMTENGKQIFAEHTQNNIGRFLGIVLDKAVISSPMIKSAITGGQATITGNFTKQSAEELAIILMTKPLPFPIKLMKE